MVHNFLLAFSGLIVLIMLIATVFSILVVIMDRISMRIDEKEKPRSWPPPDKPPQWF